MRRWLTYWYRRLRGKCIMCGGVQSAHRTGPWCFPIQYACGWCNKRVQHGMNYGMSASKLQQQVYNNARR